MKKILGIITLAMLFSCNSGEYQKKQNETISRMERCENSIHTAWICKHALANEEAVEFAGKEYERNMRSVWEKERKLSTLVLDSIKADFETLKDLGGESYNDMVSLYGNLQQYYDIAINPKGLNDHTSIDAEALRLNLEKSFTEFKFKHVKPE